MLARLLGVPTGVCVASYEQMHDLLRELLIVEVGQGMGLETPDELVELLPHLRELEGYRSRAWDLAKAAADRGAAITYLELELPTRAIPVARRTLEFLERSDELCRRGVLMTLCADGEVTEFRRWMVGELEAQSSGAAPSRYSPSRHRAD